MVVRLNHKRLDTNATYSTAEVASITGYGERTIRRYATDNLLPWAGSPTKRLFHGADVAEFLGVLPNHPQTTPLVD